MTTQLKSNLLIEHINMFLIIPLLKVLLYHDSVIDATTTQCQINNKLPRNVFLRLFKRTSKKTSKLRVTGLCKGNFPGEFPAQKPVTPKMFPFYDVIMVATH